MSQFQRCKQTYTQTNVTGSQHQAVISDLTCAASGFFPSLQAATNTASGDLTPILVRSASLRYVIQSDKPKQSAPHPRKRYSTAETSPATS
ncbi:MAG: hypothetical protein ACYTXI_42895 [Nostoc sp.]